MMTGKAFAPVSPLITIKSTKNHISNLRIEMVSKSTKNHISNLRIEMVSGTRNFESSNKTLHF